MSLSVLLVDKTGVAQYDLIATSPGPILVADFEGGSHKLGKVTPWLPKDIAAGKFPEVTSGIVTAVVENYGQFSTLLGALQSPKSPFRSFWIMSATVLTQLGETEIARQKHNTQQGFGELLNFLRPALTALTQMAARSDTKLEVFGATAWCREDRQAPSMVGGIATWFANMMDVVGYPSIAGVSDGKISYTMQLTRGTKQLFLKHGETITNPDFTEINGEH